MTPAQLVLFFRNGEPGSSFSLLEELLGVAQASGAFQPVLCDGAGATRFRTGAWGKNVRHFLQDAAKQAVFGKIPSVPLAQLPAFLRTVARKKPQERYDALRYFVAADESMLEHFVASQARILCLLKPDPSAASFLYNILRKARLNGREYPETLIVVRDMKRIEEAAEFFAKVREEVSNLLDDEIPLVFCGNISLNEDKLSVVPRDSTGSLTDLFPGDSFHGQLKYASKRMAAVYAESRVADEKAMLDLVEKLSGESQPAV